MNTVTLEFPLDAWASAGASAETLATEAKFMLALKLFEVGRLSSGRAGQLCGMGRVEFLFAAGRAGCPDRKKRSRGGSITSPASRR